MRSNGIAKRYWESFGELRTVFSFLEPSGNAFVRSQISRNIDYGAFNEVLGAIQGYLEIVIRVEFLTRKTKKKNEFFPTIELFEASYAFR